MEPYTHLRRLFERNTGQEPFKVPAELAGARASSIRTRRSISSTNNDIVGGNSGSPLIDAAGASSG